MIVGVDSRVLVGSVMKGRSSSYKLNGILRSLTSLLVCYRIYLALPWIGTKSNSSDYPSRMVDLPPQPSASPDVVDLVGPAFAREHLVAAPGSCVDIDKKKKVVVERWPILQYPMLCHAQIRPHVYLHVPMARMHQLRQVMPKRPGLRCREPRWHVLSGSQILRSCAVVSIIA